MKKKNSRNDNDVVLIVPLRAMWPVAAVVVEPPASFGEEDQWVYSLRMREAERTPALWQPLPLGTWAVAADGVLVYQLRRFTLDDPRLRFSECRPDALDRELAYAGKLNTVEKYTAWLRAGHDTPPIRGLETARGAVKVADGHHRAAARYRAGLRDILVWVSPYDNPLAPRLERAS